METMVGSYIAGQGILCLIIGILALIAYLLIGLPNALVLAFVAGVLVIALLYAPTRQKFNKANADLEHANAVAKQLAGQYVQRERNEVKKIHWMFASGLHKLANIHNP
jgi:membrane protein implicated in regulation of membrane protease activity